jgi:hypothetical protein
MDGYLLLAIQIGSTALTGLVLFLLKDIKEDLKNANSNFLNHASDLSLHCSRDKFKIHITER